MSHLYMLDTNTVSFLLRGHALIRKKLCSLPADACCISVITEAELRFGLARKPEATKVALLVREALLRLPALPWDSAAAASYALLRATTQQKGICLGNMDMLIAAHAHATHLTLVSNDATLALVHPDVRVEDWTSGRP